MVLPQILTFATSLSIVALAAIGLIYYFENHTEQRRTHSSRPSNSTGHRSHFASKYNPSEEDIYCTICLEEISSASRWTLPCKHSFHRDCLLKWTVNKQECPNCRKEF